MVGALGTTQFAIIANLRTNPVKGILFYNIVGYAARRVIKKPNLASLRMELHSKARQNRFFLRT